MYVIGILHCHTVISRTEVVFPNRRIYCNRLFLYISTRSEKKRKFIDEIDFQQ